VTRKLPLLASVISIRNTSIDVW